MAMKGENEYIVSKEDRKFSAIDIVDGSSLLADSILSSIPPKPSTLCSIYRVPDNLKNGYEGKYEPSVVSIGPYHRYKQNMKITEKHKLWYLHDFISRATPPQTSFKDMVKAVTNLEEKARACYAEEIHLSSDDFLKMMVIDGCFILELFYRNLDFNRIPEASREEDCIYSAPWVIETVKQDLLLLENQLPFIILVCLYQLNTHHRSLNYMVFEYFYYGSNNGVIRFFETGLTEKSADMVEGSHILDFLRNCIIPDKFHPMSFSKSVSRCNLPCAKDLQEMGVKFKRESKYPSIMFLDVKFEEGCLTFNYLPDGIMYSLFPNWIALEQCHRHFKGYITSYTIFLGQVINSKDDMKFLRKSDIFDGNEDEDEKFVTEIKMLCQRAKPIEYHYNELAHDVQDYTQTRWNRQRANLHNWIVILKRDYFGTPWAVISFIAAIVLLVLTAIQTVIAFLSYSPKG